MPADFELAYLEYWQLMEHHDRYTKAGMDDKSHLSRPDLQRIDQVRGSAVSLFMTQFKGDHFQNQVAVELEQAVSKWDFIRLRFLGYVIFLAGSDGLTDILLEVVHQWTLGLSDSKSQKILIEYAFILEQFIQVLPYDGSKKMMSLLDALLRVRFEKEPPLDLYPSWRAALSHIAITRCKESLGILNSHRQHPFQDLREDVEEWLQEYKEDGLSDVQGDWAG